jgi:hypothetical protein
VTSKKRKKKKRKKEVGTSILTPATNGDPIPTIEI